MVINENVERKVIPIASGKGGVGKTLIAANLAIALAQNDKKTLVVDCALGDSNLHSHLGLKNINTGIGNYLVSRKVVFDDIIVPTEFENLWFVPGDVLVVGSADITAVQRKKILDELLEIDVDYLIIDCGPGSSSMVLDFFLSSNSGILVTSPSSTSLIAAFLFLKNLLFRFLLRAFAPHKKIESYLKGVIKEKRPGEIPSMETIGKKIQKIDHKAYDKYKRYIEVLQPKLVLNMVETPEDLYNALKLRDLIKENLQLDVESLGLVYRDGIVDEAMAELVPLLKYSPDSVVSKDITRIGLKIVQSKEFPHMPFDIEYYKDSYELARIEAANDFEELESFKRPDEKFDVGELLAVIREQKKQINELRGTVRMLTLKNEF